MVGLQHRGRAAVDQVRRRGEGADIVVRAAHGAGAGLSPLRAPRRARGRGDSNLGPAPGAQIIDSESCGVSADQCQLAPGAAVGAGVPAAALADPPQGPSPARSIMVPLPLASCAGARVVHDGRVSGNAGRACHVAH
jgi:hypothetical protein